MAEYLVQSESITAVADAIREKGGTTAPLSFPAGMTEAVRGIPSGGTDISLGLTAATVGQTVKVKAVDADGKPTEWEAVDMLPKSPTDWEPWTAEEQAAARDRIGILGDYELIEEITTDGAAIVERTQEPDGTPYNFVAIKVAITSPKKLSSLQTVYARIFFGEKSDGTYSVYRENLDYFYRATYTWKKENNVITGNLNRPTIIYAPQGEDGGDYSEAKITPDVIVADENFTKLKVYLVNDTPIPAGFLIQIYGVRA